MSARSLVEYNYYSLPPFAVEFTTLDTAEIEVANGVISATDSQESSLSYPIRRVTEDFLLEQFEEQIYLNGVDSFHSFAEVEVSVILKHSTKNSIEGHVALIAEMDAKVAFVDDGTPSNLAPALVEGKFGPWLEFILSEKRDRYLRLLLQSDQELLREIVDLDIIYNGPLENGESPTIRILAVVTIIIGMIGLGYICIFFAKRHRFKKEIPIDYELDLTARGDDDDDKERAAGSLDAIQHGEDSPHRRSKDILNKSDQYLSKHRPDLYGSESNKAHSTFGGVGQGLSNILSVFKLPPQYFTEDHQQGQKSSPARSSFTTPRRLSSIELQAGNIAATSERAPFDDIELSPQESEQQHARMINSTTAGYRPFGSIWRKVSNMWDDSRYRQDSDGLIKYDDEYVAQIREQQLQEEQWMTFQKEEEADYNFAFKDFPRKDGTPCLIYDGENATNHQDIFTIGTPNQSADSEDELDLPPSNKAILSDDAFRKLLQSSHTSSFDNDESLDDLSDSKSPEFKNRLSSLFSEKHRQYEKRSIVERHQRKRKKERDQERRERQKDMHRELEALEASIPISENWRAKHHVSPRPYDMSPTSRSSYSPHLQVRRSPRRSPVPMSNPRRSPVQMTNMPPRHQSHKSWDLVDDSSSSIKLIRPRAVPRPTTTGPPGELFVDTRYRDPTTLDAQSLDMLSMPQMSKTSTPTIGNTKQPSPQSVMDEIFSSQMPPRNPNAHRRNTSNDLPCDYNKRGELATIGAMSPARRGLSPKRRGLSPARRGISPKRHTTMSSPSRGRRTVRGMPSSPKQRSSSNSSRHSRAGSTDGVFDHGIAALI